MWDSDAVVVDLRPGRVRALWLTAGIFIGLAGLFAAIGITNWHDPGVAAVAGVFLLLCLLPIRWTLRLRRAMSEPGGFAFGPSGLRYWEGAESGLLAWEEVAALGIGYEVAPMRGIVRRLLRDKQRVAFEVFAVDPADLRRTPALQRYLVTQPAPWPEVAAEHLRVPLPPFARLPAKLTRAARGAAPQLWRGWFRRPWTGTVWHLARGSRV